MAVKEFDNEFDSVAYANCFSETGVMLDEGKTYKGRAEIQHMVDKPNEKY